MDPEETNRKMKFHRKSTKHYQGDDINDDERGTTRNTHAGEKKFVQNFSPKT